MNDSPNNSVPLRSTRAGLLKATATALLVALVVLVLFVLPAEYGIDPTGIGTRLGLTAMSHSSQPVEMTVEDIAAEVLGESPPATLLEPTASTTPVSAVDAVWRSAAAFRSDELSLVLEPDEGGEIKALMQAGERFVFSWVAEGGVVNFDMHGEALNAQEDEFTSYWKARSAARGDGAFVAPFAGTHGWYWRNRGDAPVTVRVATSGYYEKLFRP